jgi:hypothetical protein
MSRRDDGAIYRETSGQGQESRWPLYVRALAIFHVLSYAVQWIAFLGAAGTAAILYARGHRLDGLVLGLGIGGIMCVILCSAFRRWFVRWGRRNYPEGKPESE